MRHCLSHVIVAGALLAASGCASKPVEETETTTAVPVAIDVAKVDTLRSTITSAGTVVPAPGADMTIIAPEPARIAAITKAEGDQVREGDVLVRFDIPTLPADLAAKRAAVNQATARVEAAKANLARLTGLVDRGVAAPREVEEARRTQAEAETELEQARSAVDAAAALADRTVVKALFSGVVAKRWHNPGDIVEAAASDPILRVINPALLQVVAAVPVNALSRVVPGHEATVFEAGNDEGQAARVLMRPAQIDPASAAADVRLGFVRPTRLAAGTAVTVEIIGEQHPNALVVPAAAVVHDGDDTFVMVAGPDSKAHKHAVTLGLATHSLIEIKSGLTAGERVIVRGQDGLPDGAAITITK
jgi:RND family efflux transporter MFP subunit